MAKQQIKEGQRRGKITGKTAVASTHEGQPREKRSVALDTGKIKFSPLGPWPVGCEICLRIVAKSL